MTADAAGSRAEPSKRGPRPQRRQHLFVKECGLLQGYMKGLMYAIGDDPNPLPESVNILDEIVTEYIIEMCHEAAKLATHTKRNKIKVDDFKFALRRDPLKLGRVEELLAMSKEISEARKQFDETGNSVVNK